MERKRFSLLFEVLKTSRESVSEMSLIGVESVKREVDFMENEGKTRMIELINRLSVSGSRLIPRVQRCAGKVERGISTVFNIDSGHKNDE